MQSTRADKPNRVLVRSSQPQPGLCVIRWQAFALPIQPGYQLCNDDASKHRNIHRALAPFPPAFNMGNDQPHPFSFSSERGRDSQPYECYPPARDAHRSTAVQTCPFKTPSGTEYLSWYVGSNRPSFPSARLPQPPVCPDPDTEPFSF